MKPAADRVGPGYTPDGYLAAFVVSYDDGGVERWAFTAFSQGRHGTVWESQAEHGFRTRSQAIDHAEQWLADHPIHPTTNETEEAS